MVETLIVAFVVLAILILGTLSVVVSLVWRVTHIEEELGIKEVMED